MGRDFVVTSFRTRVAHGPYSPTPPHQQAARPLEVQKTSSPLPSTIPTKSCGQNASGFALHFLLPSANLKAFCLSIYDSSLTISRDAPKLENQYARVCFSYSSKQEYNFYQFGIRFMLS